MSNDIILLGYALKRKADGAYLGSRSWILKKDALPNQSWFSGRCWRKYPQKFKELQDFAEKEFEIVKMEISTKEIP